jgi:hypothetical protein
VNDDILGQLAGASPRKVLDDLARVGTALAKNDRARPEVELFLASGQTIKGRVVAVSDDRGMVLAVLHVGGSAKQPAVTFVRVDQIAAIGITDASLLVHAPVADTPPPSRLELQRQLASRLDGLHLPIKVELGANLEDEDRRAIGALVPVLFEVLGAIAGDDLGKQALAQVHVIELAAGSEGAVVKESRGFLIRAPKLLTEQFTHQTLRRALEKQL